MSRVNKHYDRCEAADCGLCQMIEEHWRLLAEEQRGRSIEVSSFDDRLDFHLLCAPDFPDEAFDALVTIVQAEYKKLLTQAPAGTPPKESK